jgi:ATP-dependent Clp protease adaptor protein ClpS
MKSVLQNGIVQPEADQNSASKLVESRYRVIIFNNDFNGVDEVVSILMHATKCDVEEAMIETWEAHHYGKANVHFASREICSDMAEIISSIGVATDVQPEWENTNE